MVNLPTRRLLRRRRIRNRQFPELQVFYYEDRLSDGRLVYSSEIDISADDRIVIDGKSKEELEQKTKSSLQVALYCRRAAAS
jgi:hypothetical protein